MAAELKIYSESVDKGLEGVVACSTSISCVVEATLSYRGYTIQDLAENYLGCVGPLKVGELAKVALP